MNKRFLFRVASALVALALPLFLASCSGGGDKGVAVTGVTLDKQALALTMGGADDASATLTATVLPTDAGNKNVAWTSVPPSGVVTVAGSGPSATVTAVGGGMATVTATTDDGKKTASCVVTVAVSVTDITMSQPALTLLMYGEPGRLTATVLPESASNKAVTWSSSDPATARVAADALETLTPL